jgi:beta-1,4-mannosyl-glycoprotein beta-1,4-N-acetylglucosaminyltransferase
LKKADDDDIILISDVDEIPNLLKINFNQFNQKIILFKQDMFYYKFNLYIPNLKWTGTKACKKKDLINPFSIKLR